jgi:hypothetical protein
VQSHWLGIGQKKYFLFAPNLLLQTVGIAGISSGSYVVQKYYRLYKLVNVQQQETVTLQNGTINIYQQ